VSGDLTDVFNWNYKNEGIVITRLSTKSVVLFLFNMEASEFNTTWGEKSVSSLNYPSKLSLSHPQINHISYSQLNLNYALTYYFRPNYDPAVDSASNT
jgi:hypothetical protein